MSVLTRIKYYSALYADTVGIVLVILAIVSTGVAGYTYLNPPVEQIPPEEVDVQDFEATIDHSAVVSNSSNNITQIYNESEVLRNHPVYYRDSMPELTISMKADVPDDRPVNISYQLVVRHSATFEGDQFYQDEEIITSEQTRVEDGEFVSNTSIRISELEELLSGPQQAIIAGSLSSQLEFELAYMSPAQGGGMYEGQLSSPLQPEISNQAYSFPSDISAEQTERQTTQPQTRELPPNLQRVGIFVIIGLLLGAAGVTITRWSTSDINIEQLETRITEQKHEPWISEGEFPTDTDSQYVYIPTLQDLVDIAIDSNKRVLYDSDFESYAVVDESVVYYYGSKPKIIKNFVNTPA